MLGDLIPRNGGGSRTSIRGGEGDTFLVEAELSIGFSMNHRFIGRRRRRRLVRILLV